MTQPLMILAWARLRRDAMNIAANRAMTVAILQGSGTLAVIMGGIASLASMERYEKSGGRLTLPAGVPPSVMSVPSRSDRKPDAAGYPPQPRSTTPQHPIQHGTEIGGLLEPDHAGVRQHLAVAAKENDPRRSE